MRAVLATQLAAPALPVPLVVTEPAIGYGGGAARLFFDRNAPVPGEEARLPEGNAFYLIVGSAWR